MLMTVFFSKLLIGYFILFLSWTKPSYQAAYRWQLQQTKLSRGPAWVYGPSIFGTGYARHVEFSRRKVQRFEGFVKSLPHALATLKQKISRIKQIQSSIGKIRYGPSWFEKYPGFKSKSLSSRIKGGRGKAKGGSGPSINWSVLIKGTSSRQRAKAIGIGSTGYGKNVQRLLDNVWNINRRSFFKNEFDDADIVQKSQRDPTIPDVTKAAETSQINVKMKIMMEEAREAWFDIETEKKRRRKRDMEVNVYPSIFGVNLDVVPELNPKKFMRNGTSTNNNSCWHVRSVPEELRFIIPDFYKKYTETYGIPIVGSDNVTDVGLQRACYVARVLFASRRDIREAYFKWGGMIALIGDNEETTDLPGFEYLPPEKNKNTRGLGATIFSPVSTVGDDNQRCCCNDRYPKQDILIHELNHGIHLVSANNVVPGFNQRLANTYKKAMSQGKWNDTYAATNKEEYWAMGAAFFFNSYHRNDYNFNGFNVTGRASLQLYDIELYDLLSEIFPCQHEIVPRCMWRTEFACNLDSLKLIVDYVASQTSRCPIKKDVQVTSLQECLDLACFHLSNTIALRGAQCRVLRCPSQENKMLTPLADSSLAWRIYSVENLPTMDLTRELTQEIAMDCTVPRPRSRCRVKKYYRVAYVDQDTITEQECESLGGCYRPNNGSIRCHYPRQDCLDFHHQCPMLAPDQCEKDPGFMWINCALSCDTCSFLRNLNETKMEEMCRNKNINCRRWAKEGECEREKAIPYMHQYCKVACGLCTPEDPFEFAKIDKSNLETTSSTTTTTTSSPQTTVT